MVFNCRLVLAAMVDGSMMDAGGGRLEIRYPPLLRSFGRLEFGRAVPRSAQSSRSRLPVWVRRSAPSGPSGAGEADPNHCRPNVGLEKED